MANRIGISFFVLVALQVLALALLLVGCSTPYIPPKIEDAGEATASSFGGIMSYAERADVRVVWVHGMCRHTASWAVQRHSLIEQAIQVGPSSKSETKAANGAIRVTFDHKVDGHALQFRYLIWSPLDQNAKFAISFDHNEDLRRASINASLKKDLIDDCFADAVAYSGIAGDPIRKWIRSEICDGLGGSISSASRCVIDNRKPRRKTIFVAESLGSKILSDAIVSIWQHATLSERSSLAQRLSDVQMVFLLANQIPLLNAATYSENVSTKAVAGSVGNGADSLVSVFASARGSGSRSFAAEPSTPLRFVAFTDPNDLLSYRLFKGAYLPADMAITNVIVSNDQTYFGLLERPDTAHCGYGWNPAVIATVAHGYDGIRIGSIPINVPHSCGFGG